MTKCLRILEYENKRVVPTFHEFQLFSADKIPIYQQEINQSVVSFSVSFPSKVLAGCICQFILINY